MTTLPDIPRLYTALAEVLAAVLYAQAMPPRMDKRLCWGITVVWSGGYPAWRRPSGGFISTCGARGP